MITLPRSRAKSALAEFDADEIRRLVQVGKDRGLIREAGQTVTIEKNGQDATHLGTVRSQWMDVDPATAKRWLENNFRNRPVSDDVVKAYAWDMQNGSWVPTHQGIAFNDKDELIDGQHRLLAIVRSGATVRMMVTFGLPSQIEGKEMTTMDAVDRGRTRSVSDQLKIQHGFTKDASAIAALAAQLASICAGERTRRLSVGQTLDVFRAFETPARWVLAHRSKQHGLRAAGVLAGFTFALATECTSTGVDETTPGARIFESVTGDSDEPRPGTAARELRNFLTSEDAKLLTRGNDRALAELVLQAVHLDQLGKRVTTLTPATDGVDYFRGAQAQRVEAIRKLFLLPGASE